MAFNKIWGALPNFANTRGGGGLPMGFFMDQSGTWLSM